MKRAKVAVAGKIAVILHPHVDGWNKLSLEQQEKAPAAQA